MLSENGNGMIMPVAPTGFGGGGFGGGDSWGWIILLLLFASGGWGNGFGGYGGGEIYPWMNQANLTSNGFQNQLMNDNITSIRDGVQGISTQLCNSFAQAEIADNARQMASMNQNFALQSSLQDCCCENRSSIADLKYTVATENCADRAAVNDGVRNIMENCNRNNQAILDKLCQLELDGKQDRINELERQLTFASLQASQTAQTARLIADNTEQTQYIVNRVAPYPIPSYTVPNPFVPATVA